MFNFQRWLQSSFYFAPDEGGGAASAGAASQGAASQAPASTSGSSAGGTGGGTSTPSASAAPSSTPAPAAGAAGSAGSAGTLSGAAAAATPEYQSIVDVVRGYGATDLAAQYAGQEHQLLQHLLMERARAQQMEPQMRLLQEHGPAIQEFLRSRQAAQQQTQQKPWYDQWFQPPEWNSAWDRFITQDANGNIGVVPGADPTLIRKYQEHRQFRQQLADRFLSNPYEFIKPAVEQLAGQIAQQEVGKHLGGYKDAVFANQFVDSNPWLFQQNNGVPIVDPRTNQRLLSAEGQAFAQGVQKAVQLGIQDVRAQQEYALALVQRDFAVNYARSLTPAQQQQQANQQFLQNAAGAVHQGNVGPATAPAPANGNPPTLPPTSDGAARIREMLARNFQAAGYQNGQPVMSAN